MVGAQQPEELGAPGRRQPAGRREQRGEVLHHAAEERGAPAGEGAAAVDVREEAVVLREHVEVAVAVHTAPGRAVADAHPVQRGERPGGQQGGVRDGQVPVVPGGEPQAPALQELAPVRPVPHDGRHPQQLRPVGEREGGGPVLRQVAAGGVGPRLARPRHVGVAVEEHVRGAGLLQPVGDRLEGVRGEGRVPVEEEDVVARRPVQPRVAGAPWPPVRRQPQHRDPPVPGRHLVGDLGTAVRDPVADDDHLQVVEGLREHRLQAGVQGGPDVVRGDDDAEPGHGPATPAGRGGLRAGATSEGCPPRPARDQRAPGGRVR